MENEFTKIMSTKTDRELIAITTIDSEKYQKAAIDAAKTEIQLRNIGDEKIKAVTENIEVENQKISHVDTNTVSSKIRFVNFLIDFVVIFVLYGLIIPNIETLLSLTSQAERGIYRIGTLIIFITSYYIFFESKYQKTLGKIITKTKVVNLQGEKPELGDIISRTFCRFIPFDRFSFFFTRNGFHDAISKTKVIKD
ncbi:RDD family protein [Flavobacterium sp. H122]|uniref:RDD family protein n=1 Tax=Flavobacterium sp. H122 TaxID=2529860 RepID=UPI0010AB486B|nr:RDD family protein [Flavobacterium sp. H122]